MAKRALLNHMDSIQLSAQDDGSVVPTDSLGFILTRKEYKSVRYAMDAFYASWSDNEIELHNTELKSGYSRQLEAMEQKDAPSQRRPVPGYIYVIKSGNYCKIGRTKDMKQRMKTFEKSIPGGFHLVCDWYSDDTMQEEAEMHSIFATLRVNGEWFNLQDNNIRWLQDLAASKARWK